MLNAIIIPEINPDIFLITKPAIVYDNLAHQHFQADQIPGRLRQKDKKLRLGRHISQGPEAYPCNKNISCPMVVHHFSV